MNFLARWLLINFIRNRFAGRSARRGVGSGWSSAGRRQSMSRRSSYGFGSGRGRVGYPSSFGRSRGRTQVRVGGCCLPIPLGLAALGALTTRLLRGRH